MKITVKQKIILYIGVVWIILIALFANSFIKERNLNNISTINNNVNIYTKTENLT